MNRLRRLLSHELVASLVAIAIIAICYAIRARDGAPRPGGPLGHSLGIIGFLLMLSTETLYTFRKRSQRFSYGPMNVWLKVHVFTGIVGPFLVLLHTAGRFHGLAGVLTLLTLIIVGSGFVGRYIFTAVPRAIDGAELASRVLEERIAAADERLKKMGGQSLVRRVLAIAEDVPANGWMLVFGRHYWRWRTRRKLRRLLARLKGVGRDRVAGFIRLVLEHQRLRMQTRSLAAVRRFMALWHIVHIPLGGALFTLALLHIVGAMYYGSLLNW